MWVWVVCAGAVVLGILGFVPTAVAAPPSNDNFAAAQEIFSPAGAPGTLVDATAEAGEPDHFPGLEALSTVWFKWRSPGTGIATFDTCYSDFDSVLAVYTGSTLNALQLQGNNDDSEDPALSCTDPGQNDLGSVVRLSVTAGTEYRIAIDTVDVEGAFHLFIHGPPSTPTITSIVPVTRNPLPDQFYPAGSGGVFVRGMSDPDTRVLVYMNSACVPGGNSDGIVGANTFSGSAQDFMGLGVGYNPIPDGTTVFYAQAERGFRGPRSACSPGFVFTHDWYPGLLSSQRPKCRKGKKLRKGRCVKKKRRKRLARYR